MDRPSVVDRLHRIGDPLDVVPRSGQGRLCLLRAHLALDRLCLLRLARVRSCLNSRSTQGKSFPVV